VIRRFKRLLAEEEFVKSLQPLEAEMTEPVGPAGYPSLESGDLLIARHKGTFIRPCPATPRYNCCGLNIFHIGQGCDIGCAYCILSAYLGSEAVISFGNALTSGLEELAARLDEERANLERLRQIESAAGSEAETGSKTETSSRTENVFRPEEESSGGRERPQDSPDSAENNLRPKIPNPADPALNPRSFRYCTGEFTDSLLLDPLTRVSEKLVEFFNRQKPFTLELKTKTDFIEPLLPLDHGGRTVVSFSVNAPSVCSRLEPKAATLVNRLLAAKKVWSRGYKIGLHFDPLVHFPGWEREYRQTAELIRRHVDPASVAFVSLGCFRYLPELKPIMLMTRPSALFDAEFVRGGDGKMRYLRPIRKSMYKTVLSFLSECVSGETIVYMCMESGRMWRDVFGHDPGTFGLTEMFRKKE
jgi:DNA repair photolyase